MCQFYDLVGNSDVIAFLLKCHFVPYYISTFANVQNLYRIVFGSLQVRFLVWHILSLVAGVRMSTEYWLIT